MAAGNLTLLLARLGQGMREAEPARSLGQDAHERARRVLGPDHPITRFAAAALATATRHTTQDQDPANRRRPR